jgi:NADPH:quinone reductase-like Zn-dependent oxidoreductase
MGQTWITGHGATGKLALRESFDLQPMGTELQVRVKASGVNFANILSRMVLYPDALRPPMVAGYEVAGSVDARGPDASPEWIGKDDLGLVSMTGCRPLNGSRRERV